MGGTVCGRRNKSTQTIRIRKTIRLRVSSQNGGGFGNDSYLTATILKCGGPLAGRAECLGGSGRLDQRHPLGEAPPERDRSGRVKEEYKE